MKQFGYNLGMPSTKNQLSSSAGLLQQSFNKAMDVFDLPKDFLYRFWMPFIILFIMQAPRRD